MLCCFAMEVAPDPKDSADKAIGDLIYMLRGAEASAGILLSLMNGYATSRRMRDKVSRHYFEAELERFFADRTREAVNVSSLLKDIRLLIDMGAWQQFYNDYNQYLVDKAGQFGPDDGGDGDDT